MAGSEPEEHSLTKDHISLGRAEDNDIVVPSLIVSRHHATLTLTPNGYEIQVLPGATNTLTCQGRPVLETRLLAHGDVLRLDSEIPGMMVSMTYQAPLQAAAKVPYVVQLGEKEKLSLGRDTAKRCGAEYAECLGLSRANYTGGAALLHHRPPQHQRNLCQRQTNSRGCVAEPARYHPDQFVPAGDGEGPVHPLW